MHKGPAILKAMQVCQILIQIAVWAGFTPTASLAQFSPSQPSPLLVNFHCLALPACLCFSCIVFSPLKGHGSGLFVQLPHLFRPSGAVFIVCLHVHIQYVLSLSQPFRSRFIVVSIAYHRPTRAMFIVIFWVILHILLQVTIAGSGAFHSYLWPNLPCLRPCLV